MGGLVGYWWEWGERFAGGGAVVAEEVVEVVAV